MHQGQTNRSQLCIQRSAADECDPHYHETSVQKELLTVLNKDQAFIKNYTVEPYNNKIGRGSEKKITFKRILLLRNETARTGNALQNETIQ